MSDVTALICYKAGTSDLLEACVSSIQRHTPKDDLRVWVVYNKNEEFDASHLKGAYGFNTVGFEVEEGSGSFTHGSLLDAAVPLVQTDLILTMDSDCFPVADGWLDVLKKNLGNGAAVSGILYPWQPIPNGVVKANIERRIREHHCWNRCQVACQLTTKEFLSDISFRYGDDTGFAVSTKAQDMNLPIVGIMPSRCAIPSPMPVGFDPECNRHVCVVYGDMIYHQGGASNALTGMKIDPEGVYLNTVKRVVEELGAEFILKSEFSHKYTFDREEEVADVKMALMYQRMREYLKTHTGLFGFPL